MSVTINHDRRLFVIPTGEGYTCAGFDYVEAQLKALTSRIRELAHFAHRVREVAKGTLAQYSLYREVCDALQRSKVRTSTWFDERTPAEVQFVLEQYRQSRSALRIFYGNPDTGRDGLEEYEVIGRIGRSSGPIRVPLLLRPREHGGTAILDHRIVRLQDVRSRQVLWTHARYHLPSIGVGPSDVAGYPVAVTVDGQLHARFRSQRHADAWLSFMRGERMKPTP